MPRAGLVLRGVTGLMIVQRRSTKCGVVLSAPTIGSEARDETLAGLAKALGHPARLKIVRLLARTSGCIGGDIVQAVGLAQSTVSEHLRILKAAGVIEGRIDPPKVCYALAPGALAPLAALIADLDAAAAASACCLTPDQG